MVVLPSTGASRYHNCCTDGGTSPEYFGYTPVVKLNRWSPEETTLLPIFSGWVSVFAKIEDNVHVNNADTTPRYYFIKIQISDQVWIPDTDIT
jgi:hypothetical protein